MRNQTQMTGERRSEIADRKDKRLAFSVSGLPSPASNLFPSPVSSGFTLIEIVLSIVLMSIIGLFSIQYLSRIAQMNQTVIAQKALVDEAKTTMEFITRELRVAINTPTCGTTPVTCVVGTAYPAITFDKYLESPVSSLRKDTNAAGIKYAFSSGALTRTSGAATATLATNVTGFTVTPVSVNFYKVVLTLSGSLGQNFSLESSVKPRNITG